MLLDRHGVIQAVNHAWRMVALDNGGTALGTGLGMDYLRVCDLAAAAGIGEAAAVAADLRDVLAGNTVEREVEYRCGTDSVPRWFVVRVTPVGGRRGGALVSHLNITPRRSAEHELRHRASTDPLTGLANRELLYTRLTEALVPRMGRTGEPDVGVLYLDVDLFKVVNDQFGHAAGDEILLEVARRLRAAVRPQDTIARQGGDEFAILAPRMTAVTLAALEQRINEVLLPAHCIHGQEVFVQVSVGAHLAAAGADAAASLDAADAIMYAVKRATGSPEQSPTG